MVNEYIDRYIQPEHKWKSVDTESVAVYISHIERTDKKGGIK